MYRDYAAESTRVNPGWTEEPDSIAFWDLVRRLFDNPVTRETEYEVGKIDLLSTSQMQARVVGAQIAVVNIGSC